MFRIGCGRCSSPKQKHFGRDRAAYEKFADGTTRRINDELPFDLPQGWAWVRMRELGTFTGGHTPSKSNPKCWDGDILWVSSKDMKCKYIRDTGMKITKLGAKKLTLLKPNTVLMCTRSGILRRTFPVAIAAQELTINQDQRALTLWSPEMAEFVYAVLTAMDPMILAEYRKTGTTVESIIWEKFIRIPIPIPPLAEQKRIVAKVDDLFSLVNEIGNAVDGMAGTANRLNRKILDLAIRGRLMPQNKSDEPAIELLKRIREKRQSEEPKKRSKGMDSVIFIGSDNLPYETRDGKTVCIEDEIPFEIPDNWAWARLGNLVDIIAGVSYQKEDVCASGIRILRGGNLKENARLYLFQDDIFLPMRYSDKKTQIRKGDIVIVASTGSSTVIGRPAIALSDMV